MMDIQLAKDILEKVSKEVRAYGTFAWNFNKAREYLDKGDLIGFEEVCRGSFKWLSSKGIYYQLTDGIATTWYDTGQLRARCVYKDGVINYIWESWYPNGIKRSRLIYSDSGKKITCEDWHRNGCLSGKETLENGLREGLCERWDEGGHTVERCNYSKGLLNGLYERLDANGKVISRRIYKEGILVSWYSGSQLIEV